jgi:hypothetical protein
MEGEMRDAFATRVGAVLVKSPNARHQAARRRLIVICGVLALALASGVIGAMSGDGGEPLRQAKTGPFSYLPSQ